MACGGPEGGPLALKDEDEGIVGHGTTLVPGEAFAYATPIASREGRRGAVIVTAGKVAGGDMYGQRGYEVRYRCDESELQPGRARGATDQRGQGGQMKRWSSEPAWVTAQL